jgi:hypothetical protein
MSMGNFERVANASAEEIARARDDAKNSVAIALYLYDANRWIYGGGAFGLRLAAWIARKATDALVDSMTLLMFRLRQVRKAILPSDKIADMATQAHEVCLFSKRHEWHWRHHPRFSKILDRKRIKLAFVDEIALKRWQRELNAIIVQAAEKPPIGSNNDGQEVGTDHQAATSSAMRRADARRYGIGTRRRCLGDPLWHPAKPSGKGFGAAHQTSQTSAGINSRGKRRVLAH